MESRGSNCNCNAVHDEPHWPSCPSAFKSCNCSALTSTSQHAHWCPMSVFNAANKKSGFTYSFGNSLIPIVVGFDAFERIEKAKDAVKDYLSNLGPGTAMPTQYTKEKQAMHPMDAQPQPKATRDNPIAIESSTDDYKSLSDVLERAYQQAAHGKGRERHAQDQPFDQQPMQTISQLVGSSDGLRYQAIKKIQEAGRMDKDAAIRELLGAINYIAGTIIYMESDK